MRWLKYLNMMQVDLQTPEDHILMILEHHISKSYHISIIWYHGSSFIQPSIHQGYQLQTKQGLTSESCRHNISALTQTITFIRRVLWSPDRVNLCNQYKSKNSQKHFMLIYLYGYIYIYITKRLIGNNNLISKLNDHYQLDRKRAFGLLLIVT